MPKHNGNAVHGFSTNQSSNTKNGGKEPSVETLKSEVLEWDVFDNSNRSNNNHNKREKKPFVNARTDASEHVELRSLRSLTPHSIVSDASLSSTENESNDAHSITTFVDTHSSASTDRTHTATHHKFDDAVLSQKYLSLPSPLHSFDDALSDSVSAMANKSCNNLDNPLGTGHDLKRLQLQWTAEDRKFNAWLKEAPSMDEITAFNDALHGDTKQQYHNAAFVWVKLRFASSKSQKSQQYCWWPSQVTLGRAEQNTSPEQKKIRVTLCHQTSATTSLQKAAVSMVFECKRRRVIPFQHLWTSKNLKILKYVIQCHSDPRWLHRYNLDCVASNSGKKRRKRFYGAFKKVMRCAYKRYQQQHAALGEGFCLSACVHWMGDERVDYKRAQIVMVKGAPLHLLTDDEAATRLLMVSQLWWPGVVVRSSRHHRTHANDAVIVHLLALDVQCDYARHAVIPVNQTWLGPQTNCAQLTMIETLASQVLLTSRCNYKLHSLFTKAVHTVKKCQRAGGNGDACFSEKQWKRADTQYEALKRRKSKLKSKSKKKRRTRKRKAEEEEEEDDLQQFYGKSLTSTQMKQIMIDRSSNRNLWNFCHNPVLLNNIVHCEFEPVQLSFWLQPPLGESDIEQHVALFHQHVEELSAHHSLRRQYKTKFKKNSQAAHALDLNLRHRLYVQQNTAMCHDLVFFSATSAAAKPLMVMSTNQTPLSMCHEQLSTYGQLHRWHQPRALSQSALLPSAASCKAYASVCTDHWHRKGWFCVWYPRLIRLLQFWMQSRCFAYAAQLLALLLPVALRDFNTFVHESEFVVKCALLLLDRIDDEYRGKKQRSQDDDIIYDAHHIQAAHSLLNAFHEHKHKGQKLSRIIGESRWIRMREVMDAQRIRWLCAQSQLNGIEMQQIFRNRQHAHNSDFVFASVLVQLSSLDQENGAVPDKDNNNSDRSCNQLTSQPPPITSVSTRSRRKCGHKRKRQHHDDRRPLKKRKLMHDLDELDHFDYAADTEDDDDGDADADDEDEEEEDAEGDDQCTHEETLQQILSEQVDITQAHVTRKLPPDVFNAVTSQLQQCLRLNPYNDCYLFCMLEILCGRQWPTPATANCKLNRGALSDAYACIQQFIALQPAHPNGHRCLIRFLLRFGDHRSLPELMDAATQLARVDPCNEYLPEMFASVERSDVFANAMSDDAVLRIRCLYVQLLRAMCAIEHCDHGVQTSRWECLHNASVELQTALISLDPALSGDDELEDALRCISQLLSAKSGDWTCLYFQSDVYTRIDAHTNSNTLLQLLRWQVACCCVLYGERHCFVSALVQKYSGIDGLRTIIADVVSVLTEIPSLIELCSLLPVQPVMAAPVQPAGYGQLMLLEPCISLTPYYLQHSNYAKLFMDKACTVLEIRTNRSTLKLDCCTPWNDRHQRYELSKYEKAALHQLFHNLQVTQFLLEPTNLDWFSLARGKDELIDKCWNSMNRLKQKKLFSGLQMIENPQFCTFNQRICELCFS